VGGEGAQETLERSALEVAKRLRKIIKRNQAGGAGAVHAALASDRKLGITSLPPEFSRPEDLAKLVSSLDAASEAARTAVARVRDRPRRTSQWTVFAPPAKPPPPRPSEVAFVLAPGAVFMTARQRSQVQFYVHVVLLVLFALVGLGSITMVIVSSLMLHENLWGLVFGGLGVADVVGVLLYKPLSKMMGTHLLLHRWDVANGEAQDLLQDCQRFSAVDERMSCKRKVWETLHARLGSLKEA